MERKENKKLDQNNSYKMDGLIKLYAQGKLGILFSGEQKYEKIAGECFSKTVQICIKLDARKFLKEMIKHGVPRQFIMGFIDSYYLQDDIWLSPQTRDNW